MKRLVLFSAALALVACNSEDDTNPKAALGIMVGEVTQTSAFVQVRLCDTDKLVERDVAGAPGVVEFRMEGSDEVIEIVATDDLDYIARLVLTSLKPGTQYRCATRIGADRDSLRRRPDRDI